MSTPDVPPFSSHVPVPFLTISHRVPPTNCLPHDAHGTWVSLAGPAALEGHRETQAHQMTSVTAKHGWHLSGPGIPCWGLTWMWYCGPHWSTQWIVRDPQAKDSLFTTVTYCGQPMLGLKAHNTPTGKLPDPAYPSPQHSALGDHTEAPSSLKAAPMLAPWLFKIHTARDTHWISEIRPSNHMYAPENSRTWAYFFISVQKNTWKYCFYSLLKGTNNSLDRWKPVQNLTLDK